MDTHPYRRPLEEPLQLPSLEELPPVEEPRQPQELVVALAPWR